IGAGKQRSVLATLLLRPGEPVSLDVLIDEVWPDKAPTRAANLVSVYVHHLRRLIGDPDGQILVTRAPGYQVVLGAGELDAVRFGRLVAEGRQARASGAPERAAELLTEAIGLWRARALADVSATPLVAAEADRLEEARIEALELRAEANLACGRYGEVVPEVRRLLADRPLREKLWALYMRALYGDGGPAETLGGYGGWDPAGGGATPRGRTAKVAPGEYGPGPAGGGGGPGAAGGPRRPGGPRGCGAPPRHRCQRSPPPISPISPAAPGSWHNSA